VRAREQFALMQQFDKNHGPMSEVVKNLRERMPA